MLNAGVTDLVKLESDFLNYFYRSKQHSGFSPYGVDNLNKDNALKEKSK